MNYPKLILILVFVFGISLTNCIKQESCPPFKGAFFDIQGIESIVHHHKTSETSAPPLANNAKVEFKDYYGFILKYSVSYLSGIQEPFKMKGYGQLYALSCIYSGQKGSKSEKYKSLTVITLHDFNEQFKQGDTINALLTVGFNESIDQFLYTRDSTNIEWENLTFKLKEAPSQNSKFKVKVFIELSTGEIYSKESKAVEFK